MLVGDSMFVSDSSVVCGFVLMLLGPHCLSGQEHERERRVPRRETCAREESEEE